MSSTVPQPGFSAALAPEEATGHPTPYTPLLLGADHHKSVPIPSLLPLTKSNRQHHLHFKEIGWASLVAQW